jgi:hypothetical protein
MAEANVTGIAIKNKRLLILRQKSKQIEEFDFLDLSPSNQLPF